MSSSPHRKMYIKCANCSARPQEGEIGAACCLVSEGSDYHSMGYTNPPEWWCTSCVRFANPVCPSCKCETCKNLRFIRNQCKTCGKFESCTKCVGDEEFCNEWDEEDLPEPEDITIFKGDKCEVCGGEALSPEEVKLFVKRHRDAKFRSV